VFYLKKDTVNPVITDLESGSTVWQTSAGKSYNIDFSDTLSLLDDAQYTVSSSSLSINSDIIGWTYIFIDQSTASYTQDWQLDFSQLSGF